MKQVLFFFIIIAAVACDKGSVLTADGSSVGSTTGIAGSYSRFITVGDFLYVVDDSSLKTFDVSDDKNPTLINETTVGNRIESIFHFGGKLFIGSGEALYIYDVLDNGQPKSISSDRYFNAFEQFACDPVVANKTHAYVTISTGGSVSCGSQFNRTNELRIYDINDLKNPKLVQRYDMKRPKGLGLDGTTLFICDDTAGLKIYDCSNPMELVLIKHFDTFATYDVITDNGNLLVVGPENVYQFDYTDLNNITLVSSIAYGE